MVSARNAILAGFVAAMLASPALAQGRPAPSQEELAKRRAELIAEEWFKSAGWIADYDEARARAKEAGKPIFAYFTRTYAT